MASSSAASRAAIMYALVLLVAVVVGFFLADPTALGSIAIFLLIGGLLATPILLRWHHPLLIFSWNTAINPVFLPGRPYLWMLMAICSFFFTVMHRTIDEDQRVSQVHAMTWPLLLLVLVVFGTGWTRGGFGVQALGSQSYGGKGYYYILIAVAGYFALSSHRIPLDQAKGYVGVFFLSGLSALIPNLAWAAGAGFSFLFYFFPPEYAVEQAAGDYAVGTGIVRLFGLTVGSTALYCWLMATYGLREVLSLRKPWRLGLFLLAWLMCAFCGFRSILIFFLMLFFAQFAIERLFRTPIFPVFIGLMLIGGTLVIHQADRMPLVVQRTLSFLPLKVDPLARSSADSSLEWRLEMWRLVLPDVPKYLLLGKGYRLDPKDYAIMNLDNRAGVNSMQTAITATDYHSGPLSLVLPFGLPGVVAVGWFWIAAFRYLLWNHRHGQPALQQINTFLLVFFSVKVIFFMVFFGGFYSDIYIFVGIAGLSASLNGPVARNWQTQASVEDPDLWAMAPRRS